MKFINANEVVEEKVICDSTLSKLKDGTWLAEVGEMTSTSRIVTFGLHSIILQEGGEYYSLKTPNCAVEVVNGDVVQVTP